MRLTLEVSYTILSFLKLSCCDSLNRRIPDLLHNILTQYNLAQMTTNATQNTRNFLGEPKNESSYTLVSCTDPILSRERAA